MKRVIAVILGAMLLSISTAPVDAVPEKATAGEVMTGIAADGACAIVGMSAEQCQLTALQRARAAAIEQAAGVSVTSGTLVTNFTVAADFIKTYARGFIIKEKAIWLPLGQYQQDPSSPPIPEYRVRIFADVYIPAQKAISRGLKASLNYSVFRCGEKAQLTITAKRDAWVAVFNIRADDKVTMVFPNQYDKDTIVRGGAALVYPGKDSAVELEMQTLPGHQQDAEAFLIIALDSSYQLDFLGEFAGGEPVAFSDFFRKLAEFADHAEEVILPYEVVGEK